MELIVIFLFIFIRRLPSNQFISGIAFIAFKLHA